MGESHFAHDLVFSFRMEEGGRKYPQKLRLKKHCEIGISSFIMTIRHRLFIINRKTGETTCLVASVCLCVCMGLWNLHCTPLQQSWILLELQSLEVRLFKPFPPIAVFGKNTLYRRMATYYFKVIGGSPVTGTPVGSRTVQYSWKEASPIHVFLISIVRRVNCALAVDHAFKNCWKIFVECPSKDLGHFLYQSAHGMSMS